MDGLYIAISGTNRSDIGNLRPNLLLRLIAGRQEGTASGLHDRVAGALHIMDYKQGELTESSASSLTESQ